MSIASAVTIRLRLSGRPGGGAAPGFRPVAHSEAAPYAAIADDERRFYGVQFHPEVVHTPHGAALIVAKKMTPTQLETAQNLAHEFHARRYPWPRILSAAFIVARFRDAKAGAIAAAGASNATMRMVNLFLHKIGDSRRSRAGDVSRYGRAVGNPAA